MTRIPRRIALAVGAAISTVALAGCINVTSFTGSQTTPIGGVQVASTLCRSGSAGCGGGNSNTTPGNDATGTIQIMVGYRVSAGSTPPATLRFFDDDGVGPLFSPSPSYTSELQRLAPAPAGQQWFGYLSTPIAYSPSLGSAAIITRFGMPVAPDGTPVSTYAYLVVAGSRVVTADVPGTRPVECGATLYNIDLALGGVCVDSPSPTDVTSFKTLATRDLGIGGAASAPVAPGQTASVPFALKTTAAVPANTQATLAAATALPGGAATISPGALTLGPGSTTNATVSVNVPAGTTPGNYPVTLTATVGNDVRTGRGTVVVTRTGGTTGGPSLSNVSVSPKTIKRTRRAAPAVVSATLSEPGTLRVVAARQVPGRRKAGGVCAAPTRKLIRSGAPRCPRFITVAGISKANQPAGTRTIAFSGRGRVAGSYRLAVTLRAGGRTSTPVLVRVTVGF